MVQSVEPQIAHLANGWLEKYKLPFKLEQESLNYEIDNALNDYYSKQGGKGGNRPDCKLLLYDRYNKPWPILIEYKGYKDKLAKLDEEGHVVNTKSKGDPEYKNINTYAVNGAVHYANALLHYTNYINIIAIGMTGYLDDFGRLRHEIGVYYVSKSNFGTGQRVGDYSDFSFLAPKHFNEFIAKVEILSLTQDEIERIRQRRDPGITSTLVRLNNEIFKNEPGISETWRVYLVCATIISTIGIPGKLIPLDKRELHSSQEEGNRDGDIILRKIRVFLSDNSKQIPKSKQDLIVRTLENVLTDDNVNKAVNGESQLRRVFSKIFDDLGIYYKTGLTIDFTGRLFNEMYNWLGFAQNKVKANDIVLTPSYVANLLVKLARVNMDSYVWDFATGSAGLLVAAMNEMLADAKQKILSPEELAKKEDLIKSMQILGIEILPDIYMLAIINMILMGDGRSNILNQDSLLNYAGDYGIENESHPFPANAFVLNPPYSAEGNGMVFVEKALKMMSNGYAAIIIQSGAGSGNASKYNRRILKHSTLLASIKMPLDLFNGKSSVQTYIYVFRVGEAHQKDDAVRFIDFSNDGYKRTNRKKASNNLQDVDHAHERYAEVVELVRFGRKKMQYLNEEDFYEGHIDPTKGDDWNQSAPVDTRPTLQDFKRTVANYLSWEVSQILKQQDMEDELSQLDARLQNIKWGTYKISNLFDSSNGDFDIQKCHINGKGDWVITAGLTNNGVLGRTDINAKVFDANTITIDMFGSAFYRQFPYKMVTHARVFSLKPRFYLTSRQGIFIANTMSYLYHHFGYENMCSWEKIKDCHINLPLNHYGDIDFDFMENFIRELERNRLRELERNRLRELEAYLQATGIKDYDITPEEEKVLQLLIKR